MAAAVNSTTAYLGQGYGVRALNVSNPASPVPRGYILVGDQVEYLRVSGNLVYAACGRAGLFILDFTDPDNPVMRGHYDTPKYATKVDVYGQRAYVADQDTLQIINVSDPDNPTFVSSYDPSDNVYGVDVSNSVAYVANGTSGVLVLNVTAGGVAFRSVSDTPGSAVDIVIQGTNALVADGDNGLRILGISNPSALVLRGAVSTSDFCRSVASTSTRAYLGIGTGIQIVNISNPASPSTMSVYDPPKGFFLSVAQASGRVYAADYFYGLTVVNVSDSAKPVKEGLYLAPVGPLDGAISGQVAYVTDNYSGVMAIDISEPSRMRTLAADNSYHVAAKLKIVGNRLHVVGEYRNPDGSSASARGKYAIYDISNPSVLNRLCLVDTNTSGASGLDVVGNLAFICADTWLQIWDVSNPANPVFRGSAGGPGVVSSTTTVHVVGNRALVGYYHGLMVVDVTNPASPSVLKKISLNGSFWGHCVAKDYLFCNVFPSGQTEGNLSIYNISNPSEPVLAHIWGEGKHVSAEGDLLFVSRGDDGVDVRSLTNLFSPQPLATYLTPGSARAAFVTRGRLLALDREGSLPGSGTLWRSGVNLVLYAGTNPLMKDTFPTPNLMSPGASTGWSSFGLNSSLAYPSYDGVTGAYRAHVTAATDRLRNSGVIANASEWLPYAAVGTDQCVRAKFHIYAGGQSTPGQKNMIPNMRLRVQTRFAVNSMFELNHHSNPDVEQNAIAVDLVPSTDSSKPSVYRVDMDPVDVPYLVNNPATEGFQRAIEAFSLDPQDNGFVALTESMIGVYPLAATPDSATPVKVYATSSTDAGDLKLVEASENLLFNYVNPPPDAGEGAFGTAEFTGTIPTATQNASGVTLFTGNTPAGKIGIASRNIHPDRGTNNYATRVRAESGKQYRVRFHLTSTQQTNQQASIRMRTRSVKFAWSQKLELSGSWATDASKTYPLNANNTIAHQSLPGIGTQNPSRISNENGGWYTVIMHTPLSPDIRPEFSAGTALQTRMPNLTAQPGPTVNSASRRDILCGFDLLDSISFGQGAPLEKGQVTLDRVEVRAYDLIAD